MKHSKQFPVVSRQTAQAAALGMMWLLSPTLASAQDATTNPDSPTASPAPGAPGAPAEAHAAAPSDAPPAIDGGAPSAQTTGEPNAAAPPPNTATVEASDESAAPSAEAAPEDGLTDADVARYLEESGLDASGGEEAKLRIYGFADAGYTQFLVPDDSPWRLLYNNTGAFFVGNLNLYLDARIASTVRSLIEVRFTYLPNGSVTSLGPPTVRGTNTASDYTRNERDIALGGVSIQRAYLEWTPHPLANFKFGQWLTPYGIWNVDHGSPVIIPATRPFVIDERLLPESQTGILLEGRVDLSGALALEYGVGISNGRGPIDTYFDYDSNRGITGRLKTVYTGKGTLEAGVSAYTGQYTNAQTNLTISGGDISSFDEISDQYDEFSFAADVRYTLGGFLLQSEAMLNDRAYTDAGRPAGSGNGTLQPDFRRWGVYGLTGYRFSWFGVMPYAIVEYSPVPSAGIAELPREVLLIGGGLNVRPIAQVAVKLGFDIALFPEDRPNTFDQYGLNRLQAQVAWAF